MEHKLISGRTTVLRCRCRYYPCNVEIKFTLDTVRNTTIADVITELSFTLNRIESNRIELNHHQWIQNCATDRMMIYV